MTGSTPSTATSPTKSPEHTTTITAMPTRWAIETVSDVIPGQKEQLQCNQKRRVTPSSKQLDLWRRRFFGAPALSFWDPIGQRTVGRLSLRCEASVLDACCGSGASAIPA